MKVLPDTLVPDVIPEEDTVDAQSDAPAELEPLSFSTLSFEHGNGQAIDDLPELNPTNILLDRVPAASEELTHSEAVALRGDTFGQYRRDCRRFAVLSREQQLELGEVLMTARLKCEGCLLLQDRIFDQLVQFNSLALEFLNPTANIDQRTARTAVRVAYWELFGRFKRKGERLSTKPLLSSLRTSKRLPRK